MKRTSMAIIIPCAVVFAAGGFAFARSFVSISTSQTDEPIQAVAEVPQAIDDHAPGVVIKPVKTLYRGHFLSIEANPLAGGLHVAGEAAITDFQEGANYFWMVRVMPEEGYESTTYSDAVFESIYLDKAFQVVPEQQTDTKFDELLFPSILPGKYCVELKLIRLAPGQAAQNITDNKQLWSYAMAGGGTRVQL